MKKYYFVVTEVQGGYVEVDADNADAALEKAQIEYDNGGVRWNNVQDVKFQRCDYIKSNGCTVFTYVPLYDGEEETPDESIQE